MSGTFNAAVGDVGTFFNRATDEGQIFQNPLVDTGIAASVLLPFLAPELLGGLGVGAAAAPDLAAGATGASALGFAGDVGGDIATQLPEILVNPATVGAPLDLTAGATAADTALAGAPLDLLASGAGAGAGVAGGGAAGAGLGDLLGASALAGSVGSSLLGSGAGTIPGVGGAGAAPAAASGAPAAGGAAPSATGGGAAGGLGGGGAGGSAAANAAPVAGSTSSDAGALGFSGTPATTAPNIPGFPSYSSSGQPLSATAADPTVIASAGGGGGGLNYGDTLGPGISATGGALGDNAPLSLGGLGSGASGLLGTAGNWIANNPLMAAALGLGGGELINNLFNKPKLPYQQQQEQAAQEALNNAGNLQAAGQKDLSYQQNGTLPPGMQAQVTQALNDAIAASNSKYASMGLANSTMAQQEQQYLTLQSQALAGQLQQQLAQTGTQLISDATSDLSVASNVYSALMETQISQDNALEQSVAQFAGSLAMASAVGSQPKVTVKAA